MQYRWTQQDHSCFNHANTRLSSSLTLRWRAKTKPWRLSLPIFSDWQAYSYPLKISSLRRTGPQFS